MAYNGSGTFLINTAGQPVVSGTVISSTAFNALTADLATGLSTAITKDGQTTVTANIPMSTYKFTGLGVGSAATDSANLSQVQSTVTKLLNSVSGADTITATASPTLAAYAAGQMFYFVAAGDNTTSVTLNIDSLGAKAVTRDGATALAAADIKSGEVVVVVYDGTRFQVVSQLNSAGDARFANVSIASSLYVGGVSTFVGNAGFSANVSIASALSVGGVAAITGATTIGGNLTLSGGTANGVLYLNGSKVATSGSALVFDGSNLGVGGSPGYRFDVTGGTSSFAPSNSVGAIRAQNNSTTALELHIRPASGKNGFISFTEDTIADRWVMGVLAGNAGLLWGTGNPGSYSEQMRLTSTGLGIGTASPSRRLEVASSTAALVRITSSVGGQTGYAATEFYNAAGFGYVGTESSVAGTLFVGTTAYATILGNTAAYPIQFATNNNVRATIDSSGNLGIGTASPGSKLTVSGDIQILSTNYLSFSNTAQQTYIRASATNTLAFGTNSTQAMTLDSSGNLGIGVTSPTVRLDVAGSGNTTSRARFEKTGTGKILQFGADRDTTAVPYIGSESNHDFSFITNNTERARITSGGEVYIAGTTDQGAYNLQVNGTGVWGAGAYVNGSDARLKDNIQSLDSGLDVVKAIRPVTFQYKPEYSKDQSVQPGFIAQELQAAMAGKAYLEGVVQSGPEHLNVAYQNIIPILVKAIQELSAKVTALESK